MGYLWALEWRNKSFLGSSHFREKLYWSGGGGEVLASGEASANFFPEVLREIYLLPDLWAFYGLFRYATDDHPQTTPEKLLTP